ncbi:MAG: hypothetical protein A4S09_12270 [Proteobacteria bacterium SG_bin7]|nr:MAG: hypothetical protein A4S09_12270 [Proteobacteria bacterium SG_bin7]
MARNLILLLYLITLNIQPALAASTCANLFGASTNSQKNSWLDDLNQSKAEELRETIREFNADDEEVALTPRLKIPTVIIGIEDATKKQTLPANVKPVKIFSKYDLSVVGGGMSGVTAALTSVYQKLKTVLFDKKSKLGGLAQGNIRAGIESDVGTAYFSPLIPEQEPIYKLLGLHRWEKELAIYDPIDSIDFPKGVKGKNGQELGKVEDPWEPHAIEHELTAEWALVRWAHFKLNDLGEIPNQPIENSKTKYDKMTYEEFLLSTPRMLREWIAKNPKDKEAKKIWARLKREMAAGLIDPTITETHKGIVDRVIRYYLINYCHSALGGMPDKINAAAALNFVYSEMITRYTTPIGTNEVIRRAEFLMNFKKDLATLNKDSYVESMEEISDGVRTTYVKDGVRYQVDSKEAVFALPLNLAPKVIKNFDKIAPEHNRIIQQYVDNQQTTDYVVSIIYLKGEPSVVKQAYDDWIGRHEFNTELPTDVISTQWMKKKGFKEIGQGPDKVSALSLYHPVGPSRKHTREEMLHLIEKDIQFIKDRYDAGLVAKGEKPLDVRFAEVNFWPNSILIPRVNHFENAEILSKPVGKYIRFAISGWMGTPSHEEAQYRGWRAALEASESIKSRGKNFYADIEEK